MTDRILRQAQVPAGAVVLPNANGTAPGLYLRGRGSRTTHLFLLPGPRREFRPMFADIVVPMLRTLVPTGQTTRVRKFRIAGMGESLVEAAVGSQIGELEAVELGYCAHLGEVELRLIGEEAQLESGGSDWSARRSGPRSSRRPMNSSRRWSSTCWSPAAGRSRSPNPALAVSSRTGSRTSPERPRFSWPATSRMPTKRKSRPWAFPRKCCASTAPSAPRSPVPWPKARWCGAVPISPSPPPASPDPAAGARRSRSARSRSRLLVPPRKRRCAVSFFRATAKPSSTWPRRPHSNLLREELLSVERG